MSFDKSKFTVNPQHDSEGFTDYEARCSTDCTNPDLIAVCKRSTGALPCFQARKAVANDFAATWSQISDADLDAVHHYWTRQAVLS